MTDEAEKKFFGAVTVGARGQIVIPSEIREKFKIGAGDKLIVFAKANTIRLVPSGEFTQFLAEAAEAMEKIKK